MPPRPRFDRRAPVRELPNINDRINYPQLRVVDSDGAQLGVISREEALDVARDRELEPPQHRQSLQKQSRPWDSS